MGESSSVGGVPEIPQKQQLEKQAEGKASRGRKGLIFGGVALVWLCLDMFTKSFFNGSYALGEVISEPILGLIRFRLIHNTGAAWGMFGDATFMLGLFSLVICVVLTAYLFFLSPRESVLETVGIALVVAGGLGNAIDRFTLGYVVDFIEPVFINFPVFNIADIGVTCGFVLFVVGMFLSFRASDKDAATQDGSVDSALEEENKQ